MIAFLRASKQLFQLRVVIRERQGRDAAAFEAGRDLDGFDPPLPAGARQPPRLWVLLPAWPPEV